MISRPLRLPQKTNPLAFFHCFESSKYNFFVGAQKIVPAIPASNRRDKRRSSISQSEYRKNTHELTRMPEAVTTLYEDGGLSNSFLGDGESY